MTREERYTDELKKYDRNLYCRLEPDGYFKIYQKSKRVVHYDVDGVTIGFAIPDDKFICPLSDNWSMRGRPVEWGLLPLMQKIRSMDAMNKDAEMYKWKEQEDRIQAQKEKQLKNNAEAFASDFRASFAKEHAYTLTHNLEKTDKRRLKNG